MSDIYRPESSPSELEQLREELEEPNVEIADSHEWAAVARRTLRKSQSSQDAARKAPT